MADSGRTRLELMAERKRRDAEINREARKRGVDAQLIRKQFSFALFYTRFFKDPESQWMVLGGNALLIRTGGGRFTQDIDLARQAPWNSEEDLVAEIVSILETGDREDDFGLVVKSVKLRSEPDAYGYGHLAAEVGIEVIFGGRAFDNFKIDVTARRNISSAVARLEVHSLLKDAVLDSIPRVPTVPAENHLADKICAMYERHQGGTKPSNRYRDLADIVRLVQGVELDAQALQQILKFETGRRELVLPAGMVAPADVWESAYPQAARDFAEFPREFHQLRDSLEFAGKCLNPILARELIEGVWNPATQVWDETRN